MTDPTGVPSPLLKHTLTEAQSLTSSLAGTFSAAAVLNNLAPSQCKGNLSSLQALPTCWSQDIGTARPPHLLCEFSMQTSIVIGEWGSLGPMKKKSNSFTFWEQKMYETKFQILRNLNFPHFLTDKQKIKNAGKSNFPEFCCELHCFVHSLNMIIGMYKSLHRSWGSVQLIDLFDIKSTILFIFDSTMMNSPKLSNGSLFVNVNVGFVTQDDFPATIPAMNQARDEVTHAASWNEESGFKSQHRCYLVVLKITQKVSLYTIA